MLAPRPATRPAPAFLKFLLRPADPARSGLLLFGIFDPANELVARQRRDVLPGSQRHGVSDQGLAEVCGELVHDSTGYSLAAHGAMVNAERLARYHGLARQLQQPDGVSMRGPRDNDEGHETTNEGRTNVWRCGQTRTSSRVTGLGSGAAVVAAPEPQSIGFADPCGVSPYSVRGSS
jgi:hypothetical protein